MVNMTQNIILMWICAWRMRWTHGAALIETAVWIWKGTVTMKRRKMMRSKMKSRKMKRRRMRRRRMRMRSRLRMRMMANNLRRLARGRWQIHRLTM